MDWELDREYFSKPKVLIDKEEYDYLNDKIALLEKMLFDKKTNKGY